MYEHIDSWKNSESAFTHQLNRNKEELDNNYPPHWNNFIERVNTYPKIKRIVDIGSGAGVYCKLAEQLNKDYIGYDYSEHAVNLATKTWNGNFIMRGYEDIEPADIMNDDYVVANALCDVLPNADECVKKLLKLECPVLLLQRVRLTSQPNFYTVYETYGIKTYEFYHNRKDLLDIIQSSGYTISSSVNLYEDIFDLELIDDKPI